MNLGRSIKLLRRKRGLTQKELAGLAGMSSQSVHEIEIGLNWPRLQTLEALSGVLGESIAYIMFHSIEESDLNEGSRFQYNLFHLIFGSFLSSEGRIIDEYPSDSILGDVTAPDLPYFECSISVPDYETTMRVRREIPVSDDISDELLIPAWIKDMSSSGIPGESNLSVVRYDDNGDVVNSGNPSKTEI